MEDDYGLRVSLPGYDINKVVDYLQQFNSSWPLLKVHDTGVSNTTVDHNLGYVPFFITTNPGGGVDQFSHEGLSMSDTQLVRDSDSTSDFRYFIFRLNITENYTAPNIDGGTTKTDIDHDYGIKVSKPGASAESTDMRDFAIHSSTRSPAVHKVASGPMVEEDGDLYFEIEHGLPYTPLVFAFIKPTDNTLGYPEDRWGVVMPPVGVSGRHFTVDEDLTTGHGGPGKVCVMALKQGVDWFRKAEASIVVLKDPFHKDSVNVSYP